MSKRAVSRKHAHDTQSHTALPNLFVLTCLLTQAAFDSCLSSATLGAQAELVDYLLICKHNPEISPV